MVALFTDFFFCDAPPPHHLIPSHWEKFLIAPPPSPPPRKNVTKKSCLPLKIIIAPVYIDYEPALPGHPKLKSKGSVSQLMDDLDLINSVEQVEAMVNSIQKGVENVLRK